MAVDDALDAEALAVGEALDRRAARRARRAPRGDRPRDRVLGGVLERAGEPQHLAALGAVGGDDVDERSSGRS